VTPIHAPPTEKARREEAARDAIVVYALRGGDWFRALDAALASCDASFFLNNEPVGVSRVLAAIGLHRALSAWLKHGTILSDAVDHLLMSEEWARVCTVFGLKHPHIRSSRDA
jgi:hypothetical protein